MKMFLQDAGTFNKHCIKSPSMMGDGVSTVFLCLEVFLDKINIVFKKLKKPPHGVFVMKYTLRP